MAIDKVNFDDLNGRPVYRISLACSFPCPARYFVVFCRARPGGGDFAISVRYLSMSSTLCAYSADDSLSEVRCAIAAARGAARMRARARLRFAAARSMCGPPAACAFICAVGSDSPQY